jgi:hypothetical protein
MLPAPALPGTTEKDPVSWAPAHGLGFVGGETSASASPTSASSAVTLP